jgi:hypothetical protein
MRSDADYYDVVGDNDGIFGYMSLLACHDVCPMNCRCTRRLRTCAARSMKRGFGKGSASTNKSIPIVEARATAVAPARRHRDSARRPNDHHLELGLEPPVTHRSGRSCFEAPQQPRG